MRKTGLKIDVDLREMAEFLGAALAVSDIDVNSEYVDNVLNVAIGEADDLFNQLAASAAMSGARISHMYEWGTIGINDRGETNMYQDPMDRRARLWTNIVTGRGGNKMLSIKFEKSVATVPKPDSETTGMSEDVIASLKDHVFVWKALVLESGQNVTIKRKPGTKKLLIPYYPQGDAMFSNYDKDRGFTLRNGPITHSPGETGGNAGQFLKFWESYWGDGGAGEETVSFHVNDQINRDFMPELKVSRKYGFSPTSDSSLQRMIAAEKAKVTREINAAARTRKNRQAND